MSIDALKSIRRPSIFGYDLPLRAFARRSHYDLCDGGFEGLRMNRRNFLKSCVAIAVAPLLAKLPVPREQILESVYDPFGDFRVVTVRGQDSIIYMNAATAMKLVEKFRKSDSQCLLPIEVYDSAFFCENGFTKFIPDGTIVVISVLATSALPA